MSIRISNFVGDSPNPNIKVVQQAGGMSVIEYLQDKSVRPSTAVAAYFSSKMNVRARQLVCDLSKMAGGAVLQAGAMQWMSGDVEMTTGVKGVGDMVGKMFKGKATGESAIKPEYRGTGTVVLEPTYNHLILFDVKSWPGGLVLSDGMFLACEAALKQTVQARSNASSAIAGGEGLFNLRLTGSGLVCVESPVPYSELVVFDLDDDELKIDGNHAICWSGGLEFTVERSGKSLIGSAASGEGLVNVYRGTGRVMMEPLARTATFG